MSVTSHDDYYEFDAIGFEGLDDDFVAGYSVNTVGIALLDTTPRSTTDLPLNALATFVDSEFWLHANGGERILGVVTSIQVVPEPSSEALALIAIASGGVIWRSRTRSRRRSIGR